MGASAPNFGEITDALIDLLVAQLSPQIDIWDGVDEEDTQTVPDYPYAIVFQTNDGVTQFSDRGVMPDLTQNVLYQITGVGKTRRMADDVSQACKDVIMDMQRGPLRRTHPIEGPTSRVIDRTQNSGSGSRKEGLVWNSYLRYQFLVTRHTL